MREKSRLVADKNKYHIWIRQHCTGEREVSSGVCDDGADSDRGAAG